MPSDGGFQSAESTSRSTKRIKISRDSGRPAGNTIKSETSSASPELVSLISPEKKPVPPTVIPTAQQSVPTEPTPCHHEHSLRSLHSDLDSMRQLITCKICQHFFYEPYSLPCGHTYCYSCLSTWIVDNHKRTCPDCRALVKDQPTPSYVVREMVMIFTSKSELLPEGETSEEHIQRAEEEAEIIAAHKRNADPRTGGLFKGYFKPGNTASRNGLEGIRDVSDNVYRCPQCLNEVERGWCNQCSVRVREGDDDSLYDTDFGERLDDEVDPLDDELRAFLGHAEDFSGDYSDWSAYAGDPVIGHGHYSDHDSNADEESEEEDGDADLSDLVDDEIHYESDNESDGTERQITSRPRIRQVVIDSDDEEEQVEGDRSTPRYSRFANSSTIPDSEDDESDVDVVETNQRPRPRAYARGRSRNFAIPDSESDEGSDDDSDGETATTYRSAPGGFSPLQSAQSEDVTGDSDAASSVYDHDDYAEDEEEDFHGTRDAYGDNGERFFDDPGERPDDYSDNESESLGTGWGTQTGRTDTFRAAHGSNSPATRSSNSHRAPFRRPAFISELQHRPTVNSRPHLQPASIISRSNFNPSTAPYRSIRFVSNPSVPNHPFNLDNVLNGVHRAQRNENRVQDTEERAWASAQREIMQASRSTATARNNRRRLGHTHSRSMSSQSSAGGGVEVDYSPEGSSGSSHTVRGDDVNIGRGRVSSGRRR